MIPVCEPTLNGKELEYVSDCIKSNWISSMGKYIPLFEEKFSLFCGAKYGIGCNNGTTAIHLALEACNIRKGDEVIIPTFTMIATANAVLYSGAKPVLVDSEPRTWNIDVSKIEEKITKRTKAIMPVHIYGHPVDMNLILKLAEKYNLYVIEDAAEAHGAEYYGKKAGGLGHVSAFSFYANKIITTGEGGMVVTNDEKIAERARLLRNHAFGKPRFLHKELGFNYRMTNIQAAIGVAQMEQIEGFIAARRNNARLYNSLLQNQPGLILPVEESWAKNVYWMYGLLVDEKFGRTRDEVMEELGKLGVETRAFFIPMHQQPVFATEDPRNPELSGNYPVSDMLARNGFYLPSGSSLTKEQITEVAEKLLSLRR